mgnify:CR=1 FL=1
MDDLMTAIDYNKAYDLYCLGSRGNGKTMTSFNEIWRKYHPLGDCTGEYSMSCSATLPVVIAKEIQEAYRKALMNESYGVNPRLKDFDRDTFLRKRLNIAKTDSELRRTDYVLVSEYNSTEIVKMGESIDMKDQIRNFEIKKKSTKKGNAIVYSCNFGYGYEDIKYTIEFYEEDFWLAPEAVIALFSIMWKSATGKLIFRDHKVIAITSNKIMQILKEPDKNGNKTKYGHISYVANCMDADRYDPYTGALIAISKHVNGRMFGIPNSKSKIKRLYKQIEDFYAGYSEDLK